MIPATFLSRLYQIDFILGLLSLGISKKKKIRDDTPCIIQIYIDLILWHILIMVSFYPCETFIKTSIFCYTEPSYRFGNEKAGLILWYFYATILFSNYQHFTVFTQHISHLKVLSILYTRWYGIWTVYYYLMNKDSNAYIDWQWLVFAAWHVVIMYRLSWRHMCHRDKNVAELYITRLKV